MIIRKLSMSNLLKLGIIGLGRQGKEHLEAALRLQQKHRLKLLAICDIDKAFVSKISKELKIKGYTDYKLMIKENIMDAVVVSVPNSIYTNIIQLCLQEGISVLKEKPLALDLAEAQNYKKALGKAAIMQVSQQRLFHPYFLEAKSWLGEIGNLKYFEYSFTLNDKSKTWYWQKSLGGGAWYGLCWHILHVISWYFGEAKQISVNAINSARRNWEYDTEDTITAHLVYEDGLVGRLFACSVFPEKQEVFYIHGNKGSICVSRQKLVMTDTNGDTVKEISTPYDWMDQYEAQLDSFLKNIKIRERQQDQLSFMTMKLLSAGLESMSSSGSIINLSNEKHNV